MVKFCNTTLILESNFFPPFPCFSKRKSKRSMGEREKEFPWKRPHLPPLPFLQTSIFWPKISISKRWLEAAQLISPETVYWVKTGGIPTERESDCIFGDRPFLFLTNTKCILILMQWKALVCSSMLCCCRMISLHLNEQVVRSYHEIGLL